MGYNGQHRSWTEWNVSLWINNDYGLYTWARDLAVCFGIGNAARAMYEELDGQRTPDGARYTKTAIRLALREIL